MTTEQLLRELREACSGSRLVGRIEERVVDPDVLSVRAHLILPDTFISAFYNVATEKTAFALIQTRRRLYGVDNAKMGWHQHPFEYPEKHESCQPIGFAEFLAQVEAHYPAK